MGFVLPTLSDRTGQNTLLTLTFLRLHAIDKTLTGSKHGRQRAQLDIPNLADASADSQAAAALSLYNATRVI